MTSLSSPRLGKNICKSCAKYLNVKRSQASFGKLGPTAKGFLQSLADFACSTGVVDRGSWLRIAQQYLSCAFVRGHGIAFRNYYQSMAKSAGKDFRDGAVVPFERMWMILGS